MHNLIKLIFAILVLGYTSILDYKYREVEPNSLYISIIIAFILTSAEIVIYRMLSLYHILSLTLSILTVVVIGIISYLTGLIGGADILILIFLALLFPWKFTVNNLPLVKFITLPIITFLINSLIIVVFYSLYFLFMNLTKYKHEVSRINTPLHMKITILFTGIPMKVSKYLKSKFFYPLEIVRIRDDGSIVREYRVTFNIEEEYKDHIEYVKKLVEQGILSQDSYIWVTPGIPLIVFILLGFILSVVLGDIILYSFLKTIGVAV